MSCFVRFTPPYSNRPKDIECVDSREAQQLVEWLGKVTDLRPQIISKSVVETVIQA